MEIHLINVSLNLHNSFGQHAPSATHQGRRACLVFTRGLKCPERGVGSSEGNVFVQTVLTAIQKQSALTVILTPRWAWLSGNQGGYSISWKHQLYGTVLDCGKVEKEPKEVVYFVIQKDQGSTCSSSCLGNHNIKLYHHFKVFICDKATLF